jgi:opacity protein-like surface antigen
MKKHLSMLASALIAAGTFSAPAFAAEHYVSGNLGISWMNEINATVGPNLVTNSGFTALAALGCDYGSSRIEAEAGYQNNDLKENGAAKLMSLLGNGYYSFDVGSGIKPYLTAGVGVVQVKFSDVTFGNSRNFTENETALAYQVGAGVEIPIARKLMLDARYRYFSTAQFTTAIAGNESIGSNNVLLGLRMNF